MFCNVFTIFQQLLDRPHSQFIQVEWFMKIWSQKWEKCQLLSFVKAYWLLKHNEEPIPSCKEWDRPAKRGPCQQEGRCACLLKRLAGSACRLFFTVQINNIFLKIMSVTKRGSSYFTFYSTLVSPGLHEIGKRLELRLGFPYFKYEDTEAQTSKPLCKVVVKTVTNLGLVSLFLVQSYFH